MAQLTVEIIGAERMKKIINSIPEIFEKRELQKILRDSAQPTVNAIKAGAPSLSGETRNAVQIMDSSKYPNVFVGFSRKKSYIPEWQKAYWVEYGTLANRWFRHVFGEARRRGTKYWKGGIVPRLFLRTAVEQTRGNVEDDVLRKMTDLAMQYINKIPK